MGKLFDAVSLFQQKSSALRNFDVGMVNIFFAHLFFLFFCFFTCKHFMIMKACVLTCYLVCWYAA